MQTNAMVIDQPGGPEVMQWREIEVRAPEAGEVLIRQNAAGLNYIDTYHRQGKFGLKKFPAVIGLEGAGVIEAVGPDCQLGFEPGMRVCYAGGPPGGYAQHRVIHERHVALIPENVATELAAGVMVKGLTAHFLLRRTFIVDENATVLVHAAAGGVGLILCQWAKYLGATVIGTVGSDEKAALAKANGCDYPINYNTEHFAERVKEITDGVGCNVVYDSIGADTFTKSLDCLIPFGMMVSYGEASGPVSPLDLNELQKRGSLFLTRPSLDHYIRSHAEYLTGCSVLLQLISEGMIKANIGQTYYLRDAARAHHDLESRATTGAAILYTEA